MTQKTTPRRTRLALTGAATALALAGGTLMIGAVPAYATPAIVATDATEPPSDPAAGRLRDLRWSQLPEALRADLVELAQADESERPALRAEIQAAVDDANRQVSHAEGVKKFVVLPRDFTEDSGELTATLKVKRHVVEQHYAEQIEGMYV